MGPPNAGKTTLLKALTASRARVGDFPFTTLSPQLGVMHLDDREPLVVAEIPGLIKGAHLGKGLGYRFLRHLTRTRILVQVVDVSQVDPEQPLAPHLELEEELRASDSRLLTKPRLIVLNKADLLPPGFPLDEVTHAYEGLGRQILVVSGLKGTGLTELRQAIAAKVLSIVPPNPELTPAEPDFPGSKPV